MKMLKNNKRSWNVLDKTASSNIKGGNNIVIEQEHPPQDGVIVVVLRPV